METYVVRPTELRNWSTSQLRDEPLGQSRTGRQRPLAVVIQTRRYVRKWPFQVRSRPAKSGPSADPDFAGSTYMAQQVEGALG